MAQDVLGGLRKVRVEGYFWERRRRRPPPARPRRRRRRLERVRHTFRRSAASVDARSPRLAGQRRRRHRSDGFDKAAYQLERASNHAQDGAGDEGDATPPAAAPAGGSPGARRRLCVQHGHLDVSHVAHMSHVSRCGLVGWLVWRFRGLVRVRFGGCEVCCVVLVGVCGVGVDM
jgi:hypothetical protein